jgi:hypothetical protein
MRLKASTRKDVKREEVTPALCCAVCGDCCCPKAMASKDDESLSLPCGPDGHRATWMWVRPSAVSAEDLLPSKEASTCVLISHSPVAQCSS